MEERIKEILMHYGGMATKQIVVTEDDSILYEATQAILTAVAESKREAYKRGYAQGGVDEILRHEKASNEVLAQLGKEE